MNLLEKIEAALDCATPPMSDLLRECEAYVRAGMDQQPTAWVLEFMSQGGGISQCLSWQKSGAGVCNRLDGSEHETALFTHPNHPIPPVGECEELLLIAHMDGYHRGKQEGKKIPDRMQLVPVELTDEIADELWKTSGTFRTRELWANALKAARGES